jgi:hypothetical protein
MITLIANALIIILVGPMVTGMAVSITLVTLQAAWLWFGRKLYGGSCQTMAADYRRGWARDMVWSPREAEEVLGFLRPSTSGYVCHYPYEWSYIEITMPQGSSGGIEADKVTLWNAISEEDASPISSIRVDPQALFQMP